MNSKKLVLISLVIFLLALPMVFSVKPVTQVAGGDNVLDIRVPQADHLKIDTTLHANIHVFNRTTGLPI